MAIRQCFAILPESLQMKKFTLKCLDAYRIFLVCISIMYQISRKLKSGVIY